MAKKPDPLDLDIIEHGKWLEAHGAKRVKFLSDDEREALREEEEKTLDINRAFRDYAYARTWLLRYSVAFEWLEAEHTKMTRKKAISYLRIMALLGCAVTNQDDCKVCLARERAKNQPRKPRRR